MFYAVVIAGAFGDDLEFDPFIFCGLSFGFEVGDCIVEGVYHVFGFAFGGVAVGPRMWCWPAVEDGGESFGC